MELTETERISVCGAKSIEATSRIIQNCFIKMKELIGFLKI